MSFDFGGTADRIVELQGKIGAIMAAASEKTKAMAAEVKDLEETLFLAMRDSGLTTIKGVNAEASVKETMRVSIADYEALEKFIIRKKALHLFERRISTKAYNEIKDSLGNKPVPGLSEFLQPRISVKATK
ncbi:MAG TPA: hypothetical protein PKZ27_02935 [Rhodocyclaceae bacterium]|nr:hypothetical protein [Burkholderiaceae bacterium]HRP74521.1 hypothetical protein [Rhodocyclaceae bacterium]